MKEDDQDVRLEEIYMSLTFYYYDSGVTYVFKQQKSKLLDHGWSNVSLHCNTGATC